MALTTEPDFPLKEYLKDMISKLGHADSSEKLTNAKEVRNSRTLRIGRLYRKVYDSKLLKDLEWDLIDSSNEVNKLEFISEKSFELACEGKTVVRAVEVFIEIKDHPELTVPSVFLQIDRGVNNSYNRIISFDPTFDELGIFNCGRTNIEIYDNLMLSLKFSSYHLARGEEDNVHYF